MQYEDDYNETELSLTLQVQRSFHEQKELRRRFTSFRDNTIVEEERAKNLYSFGSIWLVADTKVHFRGERKPNSYHLNRRPGVVVVPPDRETLGEVCWAPGSSQLANRDAKTTVAHRDTVYLLCYYEWYKPITLEEMSGKLPFQAITKLRERWENVQCP